MKKWVLLLLPLALLIGACGGNTVKNEVTIEKEGSAGRSYELTMVSRGDVASSILVSLSYGTNDIKEYSFSVKNAKIEFMYVERGARVEKGDVLATLVSDGLETKLDDYKHRLKSKELELKQLIERRDFEVETEEYLFSYTHKTKEDRENTDKAIENIYQRYAMSITTYEDEITILKLRIEEAEKDYRNSRIVSEVNGIVTFCKTNLEGTTVVPGDVIIKVGDTDKCRFTSSEISKAVYFTEGMEYVVSVGAGTSAREYVVKPSKMSEWTSTMFFDVIGEADSINFNENGKINIVIEEAKDVLVIPTSALYKSKDKYYVYYLDENSVRRTKWVTPGLESKDYVEIKEGLTEGEYIILK